MSRKRLRKPFRCQLEPAIRRLAGKIVGQREFRDVAFVVPNQLEHESGLAQFKCPRTCRQVRVDGSRRSGIPWAAAMRLNDWMYWATDGLVRIGLNSSQTTMSIPISVSTMASRRPQNPGRYG